MNLLIVDDEYYSVEGLKQKLQASDLPIDQIFCAYSMMGAQEVFRENRIDILLSDIEMPKGSGLDLLDWVRQSGFQTIGLFTTSYASFDYASRALKLQSTDYLLKPVDAKDLVTAVGRAIDRVHKMEQEKLEKLHAGYWNDSQMQNAESFWQNLARGKTPPSHMMLLHELSAFHLSAETMQAVWHPVLLDCKDTEDSAAWEERLYEYAVKNILVETLFAPDEMPLMPSVGYKQHLLLLYPRQSQTEAERMRTLKAALRSLSSALPGVFHFFPAAETCSVKNLCAVCAALQTLAKNTIYAGSLIFSAEPLQAGRTEVPLPPWESWSELLLSQRVHSVQQEALAYLLALKNYPQASRQYLVVFHHDFLQMIYSLLEKTGAQAHDLFRDKETAVLSETACDSVDRMRAWVTHVLSACEACIAQAAKSSDVIGTVKRHIEEHLADELNRNALAAAVFLSPDYLSHLFAEKEKTSLTNYINARRIRRAKEMLLQGSLSIRDVALKSGFQNISYFSKQFKRQTGCTPQEFRKAKSLT